MSAAPMCDKCGLAPAAALLGIGGGGTAVDVCERCFDAVIAAELRAMGEQGVLPRPGLLGPVDDESEA